MHNTTTRLFFALVWTVLITVLSLITVGNMGGEITIPYKDKMVHFVFYFVFVLLWFQYKKTAVNPKKVSIIIFLFAISYGLLMELLQGLLTSTRTPDFFDVIANSSGALAGLLFNNYYFLNKRQL